MPKRLGLLVFSVSTAATMVLGFGSAANAAPKSYIALLNSGQEVPVLSRPGVGNAFLRHDSSTGQICWILNGDS